MDDVVCAVPDPLYLAIDQGTHASRALVFDRRGQAVSSGSAPVSITYPQPDWAEQDGDEIVASVLDCGRAGVAGARAPKGQRGRCGSREPARQRHLLGSAHAGARCRRSSAGRTGARTPGSTSWPLTATPCIGRPGLFLSPHYGASKLRWALDHLGAVREALEARTLCWGPMASFLAFRLCRERPFLADPQCAARTQLWNLHTHDWDPELLALFGLPADSCRAACPPAMPGARWTSREVGIPLTAVNGDQSAAVFAFGWPEGDSAYINIGTSAFVQRALGHFPRPCAAPAYRHHPRRRRHPRVHGGGQRERRRHGAGVGGQRTRRRASDG